MLYSFTGGRDGGSTGGLIFDSSGNLYGTSGYGGDNDYGLVFQLTPSESGWTENILYRFQNGSDGYQPWGGLIFDPSGNLYGTTTEGGSGRGGTVVVPYKLPDGSKIRPPHG